MARRGLPIGLPDAALPPDDLFTAEDNTTRVVLDHPGHGFMGHRGARSGHRKPGPTFPEKLARWKSEAERMIQSGDWQHATPVHLVALYAWCHGEVYSVEAAEINDARTYLRMAHAAKVFVETHFAGDFAEAVECIRWVWERESVSMQRGTAQGRRRITCTLQFNGVLVTDYRFALAQKAKEGAL
jgi:hypothetical protein